MTNSASSINMNIDTASLSAKTNPNNPINSANTITFFEPGCFNSVEISLGVGKFILDVREGRWLCSKGLECIFGIDDLYPKTIPGWISLIHTDDRNEIAEYFKASLTARKQFNREYRIIRNNDGVERWISESGVFNSDEFEGTLKFVGIIQDITTRKETELSLKKSNESLDLVKCEAKKDIEEVKNSKEKYKTLSENAELLNNKFQHHIENMPLGYIETNEDQKITYWNLKAEAIFGYSKEEAINKSLFELIIPDEKKNEFLESMENIELAKESEKCSNCNITKTGKAIYCDWYYTPLYNRNKEISGWALLVEDISEQVDNHKTLKENEEKIRQIFNNIPFGVVYFDLDGTIIESNENFAVILGESEKNLNGLDIFDIVDDSIKDSIRACIEGNESGYETSYVSRVSGKIISARLELAPVILEDGKIHGGVGVIEDISQKKQIERIFFHDVVNTAGNLKGLAEILLENLDNQTKYKFAKLIKNQAEQILGEIKTHRYLLASKSSEIKLEVKRINSLEFLSKQVNSFSNWSIQGNRKLRIVSNSQETDFESDPSLLGRIIGNMIKNAMEASKPMEVITLGCGLEDGMVTFWVHNDAYISEAIKNQLFTRSVSTKGEGRGLGTYSMKLLTEHLKGKIYFTSTKETGTTFVISHPLSLSD